MGSVVLVTRVVLAAIFATAGVAKLLDRQGSRAALEGFGVPQRALAAGAILLPLAELATAAALVPRPSAQWGGVAALVLLVAFMAGIAAALARGRAPDCHCFGQLHSAPAGRSTLARNAALAIPAGVVAWSGPGPAIDAWIADRTAAELVAVSCGALALLLAGAVIQLRRERRALRRALREADAHLAAFPPGLPIGATAPTFSLPSVHGSTVTLEALRARGRPVALMFVSPDCGPCEMLFPEIARWQRAVTDGLTVAVISVGAVDNNLEAARTHGADVLLQKDYEVMSAYRVGGTPTMVVVTPEGRIASTPASGAVLIETLVRLTLRRYAGSVAEGSPSPQPVA